MPIAPSTIGGGARRTRVPEFAAARAGGVAVDDGAEDSSDGFSRLRRCRRAMEVLPNHPGCPGSARRIQNKAGPPQGQAEVWIHAVVPCEMRMDHGWINPRCDAPTCKNPMSCPRAASPGPFEFESASDTKTPIILAGVPREVGIPQ